jgi:phage gpG-like protein
MQARLRQVTDQISPALEAKFRAASDKRGIHQAIGLGLVSITKRAINDPSLRPSPWKDKADGTPATLRKSGTLAKSPFMVRASEAEVVVGSDRKYAAIHQLGGKTRPHIIRAKNAKALKTPFGPRKSVKHPGSNVPARPFFPFTSTGKLTQPAIVMVVRVVELKLK